MRRFLFMAVGLAAVLAFAEGLRHRGHRAAAHLAVQRALAAAEPAAPAVSVTPVAPVAVPTPAAPPAAPVAAPSDTRAPGASPLMVDERLAVRLDFYRPNEAAVPDRTFFGPGSEPTNAWRWGDILLVDPLPGPAHTNGARSRFQVRARASGSPELLAAVTGFPVRIYRSYMNEPDDREAEFANAYRHLFGAVATNAAGEVLEPEGQVVTLRRIADADGTNAIFVSDVIDLHRETALDPACGAAPPSFAAFDADAYFSQYDRAQGDEEPDAWAWSRAMTAAGFVSAGLAHPMPDVFASAYGFSYQFGLGLADRQVLGLPRFSPYEPPDEAIAAKLRALPEALRSGALRDKLKNLGASRILGRPVANGAFIVSTGVQKLVVTARRHARNRDTDWRLPGLVHVLDGTMDQCLVRAPAPIFLFSGHGWDQNSYGWFGEHSHFLNTVTFNNPTAFSRREFPLYAVAKVPRRGWDRTTGYALPENRIDLSEKWRPGEVRLQWAFLLGCYALTPDDNPFSRDSNAGLFANLIVRDLGAKGLIGFSEHGFSSVSFLRRWAQRAGEGPIAEAWLDIWRDAEARAYGWYEQNETHGQSVRKTYDNDLWQLTPAYVVREGNAGERLVPADLAKPVAGPKLRYARLFGGATETRSGELRASGK